MHLRLVCPSGVSENQSLWALCHSWVFYVSVPLGSLHLSLWKVLCVCICFFGEGLWVCLSKEVGTHSHYLPRGGGPVPQRNQWREQGCPGCLHGARQWRQRCRAPAAGSRRAPQSPPGQLSCCGGAGDRMGISRGASPTMHPLWLHFPAHLQLTPGSPLGWKPKLLSWNYYHLPPGPCPEGGGGPWECSRHPTRGGEQTP